MAEQTIIQVRVDRELKDQAVEVFEELGIDIPTAVRMFLKTVVREQGLPFGTNIGGTRARKKAAVSDKDRREKLLAILREINPDPDYEGSETLIDDGELDSLQVMTLIFRMEEEFRIAVDPAEISAEELNSLDGMLALIERHS